MAVQYCLSFVAGVELVTVLFVAFCYVFGVRYGAITATTFSLVRCLLFGLYPNVLLLYAVYYNGTAVLFGTMGTHRKAYGVLAPIVSAALAAGCAYFALTGIPVSLLMQNEVSVFLWVLFGLCAAVTTAYAVCFCARSPRVRALLTVVVAAMFCTVLFTLLDDVLTPLFYGYDHTTALGYFYVSFTAMLPQTVCACVSVVALFYPLKRSFMRFCPDERKRRLLAADESKTESATR